MKTALFYENLLKGAKSAGLPIGDVLAEMREKGMDALYMSCESWERDREKLKPVLEELGIPIAGMYGSCDFPGDPETERYRELIDLAAEAGAGDLLFIPGMFSTGNTARDLDRMVQGMRKAVTYGRERKLPIVMEDFDGAVAPYNCAAGLEYFLRNVPGLEVAFDTGNFAFYHEDELQAYEVFREKIRTVHLKDRSTRRTHEGDHPFVQADGQMVYTCAVGSGYIRMKEILRRLKKRKYEGSVILELYGSDPRFVLEQAGESLRWFREVMAE